MAQTKALLIWGSGVLWNNPADALPELAGDSARMHIRYAPAYLSLWENLALGRIAGEELLQTACRLLPDVQKEAVADLPSHISEREGMLDVLLALRPELQLYLVCDIPKDWLVRLPGYDRLKSRFAQENILFLNESGIMRTVPDAFYYLPGAVKLPGEHCLLYDADSKRTVQAIRHELPAALVLDPMRLRRECLLRGLLPETYLVHSRPV